MLLRASALSRITRHIGARCIFLLCVFLCFLCLLSEHSQAKAKEPTYIGSSACVECHTAEARSWRASHHAWAWKLPTPETVLGDFHGITFTTRGVPTHFQTRNGEFYVQAQGPNGTPTDYKVLGTIGVAPLQQYLVETEPGRLQVFDIAWDVGARRWYDLYPDQDLSPGNGLHWTGPYKTWNTRCAECHATGYEKHYNAGTRHFASGQAEIGVGCEACHGPGEAHLAWARNPGQFDAAAWPRIDSFGLTVGFNQAHPQAEIEQCASCHARREPIGDASPVPGTPFADSYRLALLQGDLYHPDGQIKEEDYEYGSFLQSKMYAHGVRCSNCHEPHSATLRAESNALCTQCHSPAGNSQFPSLRKADYDTAQHHFHQPGTAGAECKNCHMIERVYMGIDARRDHSFRVPRPDLSVLLGTPNACNDCHKDKSAEWAAAEVSRRFPDSTHRQPTFASAFAAAWNDVDQKGTAEELLKIVFDHGNAGIVRATALAMLEPFASPDLAERSSPVLRDPDPLVRSAALPLQQASPPRVRIERILPLLQDPMRSVRIEAARSLLDVPTSYFSETDKSIVQSAMREYQESLLAKADFPEAQFAIAGAALVQRNFSGAEQAFAEAVRMDPQLVHGWAMLARIRAAEGRPIAAEDALNEALAANPGNKELSTLLDVLRRTQPVP
jgi:predicted CXXCH cytochrome family protein